jgi:AcrR family transcriptional regulator
MTRYNGTVDSTEDQGIVADANATAVPTSERPNLREDSRSRARARIIQGAMIAIAAFGLDATIDQVADASGVSRRTVTRYFATHGELIAATIDEGLTFIGTKIPAPPSSGTDVETWLTDALVNLHEVTRTLLGRAFWDIHIDRPNTPTEVTDALAKVVVERYRFAGDFANSAWRAVGGSGTTPTWVGDAFTFHISGFATFALAKYSATETGQLSARILWVVLQAAVEQQRPRDLDH